MPDRLRAALLAAHRVFPGPRRDVGDPIPLAPPWLDLSHSRPQSVRDQMVRAQTAVELAVAQGLLQPRPEKKLVVFGAGAAGTTAAYTALARQVPTLLVHDGADAFAHFQLQRNTPRYLDPTVYDWPAPHWVSGNWVGAAVLPWSVGKADEIVRTQWEPRWRHMRDQELAAGRLEIRHATRLETRESAGAHRVVLPTATDPRNEESAGMVIECLGPGAERVWPGADPLPPAGGFRAFEYWDGADPVARTDFRLGARRAVVSGGGDGALQELLWLATGLTARELADILYVDDFAQEARAVEDWYQRAYVWLGADGRTQAFMDRDHALLRRWHQDWVTQVIEHRLAFDPDLWPRIERRLRRLMPARPSVTLVHGCDHFHYCFALNRLLVLLVDRYVRCTLRAPSLLLSGMTVTAVDGLHGGACGDPRVCWGQPHRVTLTGRGEAACGGDSAAAQELDADVIVLRHGIVPNNGMQASLPIPRQMVAYAPFP